MGLGDSLFSLWRCDNQFDVDSSATEHVDKGVNAEEVDLPFVKVADARLSDTEKFRGLRLFHPLRLDRFAEVNHQGRTDLQVFGLLGGETEITENVSARTCDLLFHKAPSFIPGLVDYRVPQPTVSIVAVPNRYHSLTWFVFSSERREARRSPR